MRSDLVLLMDMLLAAQKIITFTSGLTEDGFMANELVQSAVLREIQVIGEAARQVSPEGQGQYSQVEWRLIAGMRNRIIHEYFDVRLEIVWDTVTNAVPTLASTLKKILPDDSLPGA